MIRRLCLFRDSELFRRRGAGFALALAAEALVALLLLFLAPALPGKKDAPKTTVFSLEDSSGDAEQTERAEAKQAPRHAERRPREPDATPPEVPPPPVPAPEQPPVGPRPFLELSRSDYQASDVSRITSRPMDDSPGADAGASASVGTRGDSEVSPMKGLHGEKLYVAEWYVRPTHAQLATYVSDRAFASGWGLIACRTIPNYRVEDCQELGEAPRGSGYAGSVRQAAWQFRVRPPRVGGRYLVGEWVAIRIDYERDRK